MNRGGEQRGIVELREDHPDDMRLPSNIWERRLEVERLRHGVQLLQRQQTHTELHSRQVSNRRSLTLMAFAGCFVVGGAACTMAASPAVAAAGVGAAVAGSLAELAGVVGYIRTCGGGSNGGVGTR